MFFLQGGWLGVLEKFAVQRGAEILGGLGNLGGSETQLKTMLNISVFARN